MRGYRPARLINQKTITASANPMNVSTTWSGWTSRAQTTKTASANANANAFISFSQRTLRAILGPKTDAFRFSPHVFLERGEGRP